MNSLAFFRKMEFDGFRSDVSEGLEFSRHVDGEKVQIKGLEYTLKNQIRFHCENAESQKIFSLYCITENNVNSYDPRLRCFGDWAIVILNLKEFLSRVADAAKQRKLECEYGLVEYVDKKQHTGKMGAFRKYSDLRYQSEFRILMHDHDVFALSDFFIGDISDISVLCSTDDALSIKIKPHNP